MFVDFVMMVKYPGWGLSPIPELGGGGATVSYVGISKSGGNGLSFSFCGASGSSNTVDNAPLPVDDVALPDVELIALPLDVETVSSVIAAVCAPFGCSARTCCETKRRWHKLNNQK